MKYDLILADPPWRQRRGGKKKSRPYSSGKPLPYKTLDKEKIHGYLQAAKDKAKDNHALFLWTTEKHLTTAEKIAEGLGYRRHIRIIWSKRTGPSPAFTWRFTHEYLLLYYSGKLIPIEPAQRGKWPSVIEETPTTHSTKPQKAYTMIEAVYPGARKLELFARHKRIGWDVWGDEVNSDIKLKPEGVIK